MIEYIIILGIIGFIAWKKYNIFNYPFNESGYDYYFKDPIRQILHRRRFFRDIKLYPWDLCNLDEIVFAAFEAYCKSPWGNDFVSRAIQNSEKCPLWEDEEGQRRYSIFLRLEQIKEYVLYTRKTNQYIHEQITDLTVNETTFDFEEMEEKDEEGIPYKRLKQKKRNYYLSGSYWWDGSELKHNFKKVSEDQGVKVDWGALESEIRDLNISYAKELIEYKDYIWD